MNLKDGNAVITRAFLQGFGIAVGALARDHDRPSMAADIMRMNGITFADLVEAGTAEFDLKKLRSEFAK